MKNNKFLLQAFYPTESTVEASLNLENTFRGITIWGLLPRTTRHAKKDKKNIILYKLNIDYKEKGDVKMMLKVVTVPFLQNKQVSVLKLSARFITDVIKRQLRMQAVNIVNHRS